MRQSAEAVRQESCCCCCNGVNKNQCGYRCSHAGKTMDERLKKQTAFALEIDKEKNVFRQTHLSGHGRNENDAEHAWHMAVMAYLLKEYSNEEIDIARVMIMCLIHDVVEIDAGDTYAYDEAGKATQKEREDAAKERIFSLLPKDQKKEFTEIFDEFEANETAEARFARAMDNFQPLILNHSNGGSDWREHGVTAEQVYGRQSNTKSGSEELYRVTDSIIKEHIKSGDLNNTVPKHIHEMEGILDKAVQKMDALEESIAAHEEFQSEIRKLEEYYTSQRWKDDHARDENGEFPANLKRGVLSEDGIYNMLEHNRELLDRIRK